MTDRTASRVAWASAGLLLVASTAAFGADLTRTESWNGNTSIDGQGYTTVGTVNISSGEVGAGAVIYSGSMSARWLKTDGSCGSPGSNNSYHNETGIRVVGPSATVEMVRAGTYSGSANINAVTTGYGWANTNTHGGTPSSGTFRPSSGVLRDALFGTSPIGNWTFQGQDTAGADPLCLYNYTLTLSTTLPPVPRPGSGYSVDEGSGVVLSGTTSSDDGAIALYQWDCGPGGYATGATRTCSYPDQGTQTATLWVRDNRGIERTANVSVTVRNVAPTITDVTVPGTITEGVAASMSGSATDPGADTITYAWAFGDGARATGASTSHAYADDGVQTVTFTARDEDGGIRTASRSVTVVNAAPTLVSISTGTPSEGLPASMRAEGSDVAADTVSYTWDFGDGTNGTGASLSHTYADEGLYEVVLTLSDEDGGETDVARSVTVADIAPSIAAVDVSAGTEGTSTGFRATVQQAASDTITYTWNFGDGTPLVSGTDLESTSHSYASEGEFVATLTVMDDDGSTDALDVAVSIGNGPPVIVEFTAADADEGSEADLSAAATDPGSDPLTYSWDFGDGSDVVEGVDLIEPAHIYSDNGEYTVVLTVSDDAGASVNDTRQVTVRNVDPLIEPLDSAPGLEGQALDLSASVTDPGADELSYLWTFGDGSPAVEGDSLAAVTHTYADNGEYTLTLTVTDDDGGSTQADTVVVVGNVDPVISSIGPAEASEGMPVDLSVTATDVPEDPLTYTWEFGDGSSSVTGGATVSHTWANDGVYTVTVTALDDDGGSSTDTVDVTVGNQEPVIVGITGGSASEGQSFTVSAAVTDAGADTLTYTWGFGDGSEPEAGVDLTSVDHVWPDDGDYVLTLQVNDGQATVSDQGSVVVSNVDPLISGVDVEPGAEGQATAFTATASDVPADTLTYVWDFGDGSPPVSTEADPTAEHVFSGSGSFEVTLTVTDDDGGSSSTTVDIDIANGAPSIAMLDAPDGDEGAEVLLSGQALDGSDDTLTYEWDFGDGSDLVSGVDLTEIAHTYADNGLYTVTLTVSDEDGASVSEGTDLTISNVAPVIASLTGDLLLDEASVGVWTAVATDPGDDTLTYSWSLGDGAVPQDGVDLTEIITPYADDGIYTLTLTVSDEDGGTTDASLTVVVNAVAPVLDSLADLPVIDEGSPIALSASASEVTGASLDWLWTFGDGSVPQQGPELNSVDHSYGDEGTYLVNVTVTDDDDLTDSRGIEVVVVNVAPSLQGNTPVVAAFEGQDIAYQPTVLEPGDDVLTWSLIDGPEGATIDSETGAVSWTPTYEQSLDGSADFSIAVDDGDGGSDQLDWTVTVFFADTDEDGLADEWEIDNGFDPEDPSDGNLDPDGDGRSNLLEFQTNTDPNVYNGPGAPEPVSPRDGETAANSRPTLTWTDAEHPLGEVVIYEAEVYADALLTDLLTTLTSQEDALTGRVGDVLPENSVVFWRVRGADVYVSGDWSSAVDFFVDGTSEAPPTPEPTFPIDGEWLTTTPPIFQWNESVDPDRDAVVYDVEVFDIDEAVVASVVGVEDLTWESDVALEEDAEYTWSVRAIDEDDEMSEWSLPEPFFYSTSDLAPEGLAWTYPVDFAQVMTPSPTLTLAQATDPERTEVTTTIELDTVPSYDSGSGWSTELPNTEGGELAWDLAVDGIELPERTLIYARAQAIDESDIASPWVETTLRLGGADVAPTVPELLSPTADAAFEDAETVTFVLGNSTDADGDAISYTLVVSADAELLDLLISEPDIAETPEGTVTVDVDVSSLPVGVYYWSAEATDTTGLTSGFAMSEAFGLSEASAAVVGSACSCSSGPSGSVAWLLAPLGLLGLRRRRR
jgi:MYXO-CTERM domain-containing protein